MGPVLSDVPTTGPSPIMSNSRPSRRWTLEATRRPQPGPRAGTPRQAPHFRAAAQGPAGTAAARGQRQAAAAILPAALGGASCRPAPPPQGQPAQGTADGRVRNLHLCHTRALPLGLCLPGRLHNSACHGHCPCRPPCAHVPSPSPPTAFPASAAIISVGATSDQVQWHTIPHDQAQLPTWKPWLHGCGHALARRRWPKRQPLADPPD